MHSATITTDKTLDFNDLIIRLMSIYQPRYPEDIKVIAASDNNLRLAVAEKSLQGIFIDKTDEGYEVRINSLSSRGDYILFRDILFDLSETLDEKIILDNETPINNSQTIKLFDWNKWVEEEMKHDMDMLKSYLSEYGTPRSFAGVFIPFSVGLRFLYGSELLEVDPIDTLASRQWLFKDTPMAKSGKVIEENTRTECTMTLFEYDEKIGEAGLIVTLAESLCICQNKNQFMSFARFRHARQIFPNAMMFDEEQVVIPRTLTEEDKKEIEKNAEIFKEMDIFHDPVMPGFGYNPNQRTFVLMWDPAISSVKTDDFGYWLKHMRMEDSNWSVFESDEARIGDRWFLIACGDTVPNGIAGSGIFDSNPWLGEDWSGKEREVYYCDLYPNALINPSSQELVTTAELEYHFPDFEWSHGHSGRLLPEEYARELETLWASRVNKWMLMADREDLHVFKS